MKLKLFFALLLLSAVGLQAQTFGDNRIKSEAKLVFYGLDFSKAKLIGHEGFSDPNDIKNRFFDMWNRLMVNEADKYNFKKVFKMDDLEYDLSVIEERNQIPNAEELVIEGAHSLAESDVRDIIQEYNGSEHSEGLGLVFIIETFNKREEEATMWVTFFDIATKEIVLTGHYTGEPGGFGIRNYWARTVYEVLEQLEKDYKKWLKKN